MTNQPHHDDPAADAAARAAQLAAMTLSIAEGVARLQAERLAARAADDDRQAAALRAQVRADRAVNWLAGGHTGSTPAEPMTPAAAASSASSPSSPETEPARSVTIVCTPADLAGQAFPVGMPEAMATAPQAACDPVRALPALTAGRPRPQLTSGTSPTPSRGGAAR